eukprot:464936_1
MARQLQNDVVPTHGLIGKNLNNHQNPLTNMSINCNYSETYSRDSFVSINTFDSIYNKDSKHLLAQGGQSSIYAYLTNTKQLVIGKEYDTSKKQNTLSSIWREYMLIKNTQLLYYDNIYYDEREEKCIIVSETLNYTLRNYIQKQNINRNIAENECKYIILDIMDKLWTIHKTGFIHNDLTPDNIMYRNGDFYKQNDNIGWKIIDFGLILSTEECNRNTYRYFGTRGWTPPEIIVDSENNKYSYAKDIWALGLIILYIVCKTQPYLLTGYEQAILCKGNRYKYKQYFYYNKLLQLPYSTKLLNNNNNNKFKKFMKKQFKKGSTGRQKTADMMDFKAGSLYLKKYLMNLYENNKISYDLCNLLSNYMLTFDPKKK